MGSFPIANPIYQPAIREIADLTPFYENNELLLFVETTQDHLYKKGLVVRFNIPLEYQAQQINSLFSQILIISSKAFFMLLPPIQFDPFIVPVSRQQIPLTIPISENVFLLNSAVINTLFNTSQL